MKPPLPSAQAALYIAVAVLAVVVLAAASRPVTAVCEQYLASHPDTRGDRHGHHQ